MYIDWKVYFPIELLVFIGWSILIAPFLELPVVFLTTCGLPTK